MPALSEADWCNMQKIARTRKSVKKPHPERKVRIVEVPSDEIDVWTVRVQIAGETTLYDVCAAKTQTGPCWIVRKVLGSVEETIKQTPYVVVLDGDFGRSCTCKGCKYYGSCRHIDFLTALVEKGQLPDLWTE